MGYFSNGTEGDMYEEQFCARCWHNRHGDHPTNPRPCPVLTAHMIYNYEQGRDGGDKVRDILSMLIPYEDGRNGKCTMFKLRKA